MYDDYPKSIALLVMTYGTTCYLCGLEVTPDDVNRDHVIPKSLGGANRLTNLRPTHPSCNAKRGVSPVEVSDAVFIEWPVGIEWWIRRHGVACYLCGRFVAPDDVTRDYVLPRDGKFRRSQPGKYSKLYSKNVRPVHLACKAAKGEMCPGEFLIRESSTK